MKTKIIKKICASQRGSAAAIAIVASGAVVGTSYFLMQRMGNLSSQTASDVKAARVLPIKDKVTRMGGFLVASNLIVCRHSIWKDGGKAESCRWNSKNYAGSSKSFSPQEFGLAGGELDQENFIDFSLDADFLFPNEVNAGLLAKEGHRVRFTLRRADSFKQNLGSLGKIEGQYEKDDWLVFMEGYISYFDLNKTIKRAPFSAAFKRPIAVPVVEVTSSSCAQRCDVSLTENPNPACRSSFYIDESSMTEIEATTTNLGPGTIYDLKYQRTAAYRSGASLEESPEPPMSVNIGIDNYLIPGSKKLWADNFPCATFSQNVTVNKTVQAGPNIYEYLFSPVEIIIPQARAQWRRVGRGSSSSTSLSQHSNPAGTIIYQVGIDENSNLEPSRFTAPLNPVPQEFSGLMKTTTTTNFYTWVYVSPPH